MKKKIGLRAVIPIHLLEENAADKSISVFRNYRC